MNTSTGYVVALVNYDNVVFNNIIVVDPSPEQLNLLRISSNAQYAISCRDYGASFIGGTWNSETNKFYPPKPFPSFVWDEENATWEAPIPLPTDNKMYEWSEATQSWTEVPGFEPLQGTPDTEPLL
jgi:hypothetical protein